jgi:hypothetical protein
LARRVCFLILRSRIIPFELGSKKISGLQVRAWSQIVCSLLEGSAGVALSCIGVQFERHATTRSLRLEADTYYTLYPQTSKLHSPRALSVHRPVSTSSCDIQVSVRFTLNRSWLLTAKVASRVVAESSRSGPRWQFYKQIYSPLHDPRGRNPAGLQSTSYHLAVRKAIRYIDPIYFRHHRCDQFLDLLQHVSFQSLPR